MAQFVTGIALGGLIKKQMVNQDQGCVAKLDLTFVCNFVTGVKFLPSVSQSSDCNELP